MPADREDSALQVRGGVQAPPSINQAFVRAKPKPPSERELLEGVLAGDRVRLSQAITLTESTRQEDRGLARRVVEACLPRSGNSVRVGITGVPGVGKSTLIESLGNRIVERGHRVCVLAVDPSSQVSGGSILGDKSRMTTLSSNPGAYVRPSPSRGSLGGVTRNTREAIVLCEAAGFDVVLVETVGVGQSESAVHSMVDTFLLLMLAGAGDELQGIKRGIMEMADLLAITKADGDNRTKAQVARVSYQNALHLFPQGPAGWTPPVLTCSALTGEGIDALWDTAMEHVALLKVKGLFESRRAQQAVDWMQGALREALYDRFVADTGNQRRIAQLEESVRSGALTPGAAIDQLLG